ncbi:platelet endothelial aggregation receptor 1-like isoform X2 [Dreissena polymorpha]|uniref:platelet endothelial aggregation receptor 1-like isoform X2 n=1 Tax=Dreissena polymorpha TaxID=45954 RepID=UPI0022646FDF|nr:platelet endothelial aggregation receptor 1-like isoform X2 [Dreissena polymorpha]
MIVRLLNQLSILNLFFAINASLAIHCEGNHIGDNCKYCKDGFYGLSCERLCNTKCKACHSQTYCYSCKNGFYGTNCQLLCPDTCQQCVFSSKCTMCIHGYFGEKCELMCNGHCFNRQCDKNTGICDKCSDGFFGQNCSRNCSSGCMAGVCERLSGTCHYGCHYGHTGLNCCPSGFAGIHCRENCSENCRICSSLSVCDMCKAGYNGNKCELENNEVVTFGEWKIAVVTITVGVGVIIIFVILVAAGRYMKRRQEQNELETLQMNEIRIHCSNATEGSNYNFLNDSRDIHQYEEVL